MNASSTPEEPDPGARPEGGDDPEMECPDCGTVGGADVRRSTGQFDDGTYVETFSCKRCARAIESEDGAPVRREAVISERYIRVDGTPMVPSERE
jgi:hypothetical protein